MAVGVQGMIEGHSHMPYIFPKEDPAKIAGEFLIDVIKKDK